MADLDLGNVRPLVLLNLRAIYSLQFSHCEHNSHPRNWCTFSAMTTKYIEQFERATILIYAHTVQLHWPLDLLLYQCVDFGKRGRRSRPMEAKMKWIFFFLKHFEKVSILMSIWQKCQLWYFTIPVFFSFKSTEPQRLTVKWKKKCPQLYKFFQWFQITKGKKLPLKGKIWRFCILPFRLASADEDVQNWLDFTPLGFLIYSKKNVSVCFCLSLHTF